MKRKIIHVIGSLGIGGAQTMLYELYKSIEQYYPNVEQKVIALHQKKMKTGVISSYDIPYQQSLYGIFSRMMQDMDGDNLIVFHKLMCSDLSILRSLYGKIPIVLINHTHTDSKIYNRISNVDHIVAVCKNMKSNLRRLGVRGPISVIPNGVNGYMYDTIDPIEREDNVFLTGRVNSLNTIKYSSKWIRWCMEAQLPKKMVHQYIGTGNSIKKANLVSKNKSSRNIVNMMGAIGKFEDKVKLIKSWDAFLYEINRPEGMSMAVLESLACGIPVICSNHPGNSEIIVNGVNGFVFKNKSDAETILTELCLNPDLLIKLKKTTKEHFNNNLDARIMADRYIKLFSDISDAWTGRKHKSTDSSGQVSIRKRNRKITSSSRKKIKNKNDKRSKINAIDVVNKRKNNGIFTILTAGYNNKKYISDWAKSILSQTYRPLEVVFVDDKSTDLTLKKVESYRSEFESCGISLKTLSNKNKKFCSGSYKIAHENSPDSSYWGVLDADDMLSPGAVSYVVGLYEKYPEVSWIYTQYQFCDVRMRPKGKGFCKAPKRGMSLLDMGRRRIHSYSHWRTFSNRFPRLQKIWKPGLKSAVDKFMGYRLEEFGIGLFTDKVCYLYRQGSPGCISKTEKTHKDWDMVKKEAVSRRIKYRFKPHKIIVHKD